MSNNKRKSNNKFYSKTLCTIKVNELDYEVIEESDGEHVGIGTEDDPDAATLGLCDNLNDRIYVYHNMKRSNKRRTLAHELAHAYVYAAFCRKEEYTEEEMCNFIESYVFDIVDIVNEVYPINN